MIRCIRVTQVNPDKDVEENRLKNCRPLYGDLFKATGMEGEEPIMWALGHVHPKLSEGDNLSSFGVPYDKEIASEHVIEVIEIDEEKVGSFRIHDYYDWSDYVFFKGEGNESEATLSMSLIMDYKGTADVEQVIFKEDAIKHRIAYKSSGFLVTVLWRHLYAVYVENMPDVDWSLYEDAVSNITAKFTPTLGLDIDGEIVSPLSKFTAPDDGGDK